MLYLRPERVCNTCAERLASRAIYCTKISSHRDQWHVTRKLYSFSLGSLLYLKAIDIHKIHCIKVYNYLKKTRLCRERRSNFIEISNKQCGGTCTGVQVPFKIARAIARHHPCLGTCRLCQHRLSCTLHHLVTCQTLFSSCFVSVLR